MTDKHFKDLSFLQLLAIAAILAIGLSVIFVTASNKELVTNVFNSDSDTPEGAAQEVQGLENELDLEQLEENLPQELQELDVEIQGLEEEAGI